MSNVDLKYLAVWDNKTEENLENLSIEKIKESASENLLFFMKNLYQCQREELENNLTAFKVPESVVVLPRIRPMPGPKKLTKWEKFAKEKGIQKKKKESVIWDDETKQWRPRYGFNKKDNLHEKWVIETPKDFNPGSGEDPFTQSKKKSQHKRDQNELKRLKNIARNQKQVGKIVSQTTGIDLKENKLNIKKKLTDKHINQIHVSTASAGKFQENIKKGKKIKIKTQEKQTFSSNTSNFQAETDYALNLFSKISKK